MHFDKKNLIITLRMPTDEIDYAIAVLRRIPRVIFSVGAFRDRVHIDAPSLAYSMFYITHKSIEDGEAVSAKHTERSEVKDPR